MALALVSALLLLAPTGVAAGDFDPFATQEDVPRSPVNNMLRADVGFDPCGVGTIAGPLDLGDVVERALCHNPDTRLAWTNVRVQAAQVGTAQAAYLPVVNASASITRATKQTSVKDFPQLDSSPRTRTQAQDLSASWTLFDFGLRAASVEHSRQLLVAATASHDATLQSVFMTAAQSYYALLSAQGGLEAAKDSERFANESFLAAAAKHKAGAGTLADKLQAQTTYAQARLNRVKAEGEVKNAQGTLAITMGLGANTALTLSARTGELPDTAFVQSIEAMIENAAREHPSMLAAQAQVRAARASLDAAKAQGLPSVSLTGSMARSKQVGQLPADTRVRDRSIGLQLSIPLFEGFAHSYRIRAAEAQLDAKTIELAKQEQKVSLEVWTNYQTLLTETEDLRATDELLQSADQSFKVAQGRYKAGIGSMLELLNAQSALAQGQQQRIQALGKWHTARLALAASLGKLGIWAIQPRSR